MKLAGLFTTTTVCLSLFSGTLNATEEDIYSVHFSEDGKYLVTGGASGITLADARKHSGGIKIWNSETGALEEALGQRSDLDSIFGQQYGRVGSRHWGISNFKDVVLSGSYPNGKVLVLPSSLGRMVNNDHVQMPDFIGGYMDFSAKRANRIELSQLTKEQGNCDPESGFHDYIGPVVPSNNGHYAAIVVNTCKSTTAGDGRNPRVEYRSDLHIMDLTRFKVIKSVERIDAGVYALGITDHGGRIAFVGRDRFAIMDLDSGKQRLVETYEDGEFTIPGQFSTLQFSKDGKKLISLRNIYDIESGTEQVLQWAKGDSHKPRRISSVRIAPDLSYFAIVIPKRSLIMFGDDGLPHSYGKADKVVLLSTENGKRTELQVTNSMTEGKRCVTDISPDSLRVAVGCKGGLLRVYNARTGGLIWSKRNMGEKQDNGLMKVQHDTLDPPPGALANAFVH